MHEQPVWPQILWRERVGNRLAMGMRLPEELVWFEGHFARCPILPGVVLVHWAAMLFLSEMGKELVFKRMEAIKFKRLLVPEMAVTLEMAYDPIRLRLLFRYFSGESEFSSGRLYWAEG